MKQKRVLVACEYSGRVREAFRAKGFHAESYDLIPSEDNSKFHTVGDVTEALKQDWDIVIAHPPCTYLANSGVRWLYTPQGRNEPRWKLLEEAVEFFHMCLCANAPLVLVENPVMHKHARELLVNKGIPYGYKKDGRPSFTVQPYQFGDPERKRTCFWSKGIAPLKPTSDLTKEDALQSTWKMGPSEHRWKERSRTFQGIANAIADQVSENLEPSSNTYV